MSLKAIRFHNLLSSSRIASSRLQSPLNIESTDAVQSTHRTHAEVIHIRSFALIGTLRKSLMWTFNMTHTQSDLYAFRDVENSALHQKERSP